MTCFTPLQLTLGIEHSDLKQISQGKNLKLTCNKGGIFKAPALINMTPPTAKARVRSLHGDLPDFISTSNSYGCKIYTH